MYRHDAPQKPETMGSIELILERGLNSWLQVTVDGSYNYLQDMIDQVPDPSTGLSHFVNAQEQGHFKTPQPIRGIKQYPIEGTS
jgi:hypothetical protein